MNKTLPVQWLGTIAFEDALHYQEKLVEAVSKNSEKEVLLLLEHDPVFTIGRTRDESSLPHTASLPHPLYRINRGGQATYHGPGQLIGYPILHLAQRGKDLHRYLRFLEEVLLCTLQEYGVQGEHRDGLTGVWVEDRKIASLGIGVRHWVSMHGFALNISRELPGFASIIPCGITGVIMTSLAQETGREFSTEAVAQTLAPHFLKLLVTLLSKEDSGGNSL